MLSRLLPHIQAAAWTSFLCQRTTLWRDEGAQSHMPKWFLLLWSVQTVLNGDAVTSCSSHCSRRQGEQLGRWGRRWAAAEGVILVLRVLWRKRKVDENWVGEAETPCSCFWKVKAGLEPGGESLIDWLREGGEAEEEPPWQRGGCSCGVGSKETDGQEAGHFFE